MDISHETPKDRSYLIQPGEVRNPGGRPPEVRHVKELARQWTVEAIQTLGSIMTDKREKGSARVAAANALLDRGYGRAPLTFDDAPEEVEDLREAARRLAFLMNGAILRGDAAQVIDVQATEVKEEKPNGAPPVRDSHSKRELKKEQKMRAALLESIEKKEARRLAREAKKAARAAAVVENPIES